MTILILIIYIPILVLQFLRDASILEYVQCKSVYGRPLGIRQPQREQEFPDGGPAYHRRAISDRHVRRRNVQCRPVILERLGNHYRLDFSGSLDRRDRPVNRKMEKINKKRGLRKKLTQPSSLTSKSLTEILTSCKSYTHKQPSHPTLLQYGATGCISPYGPNGSKNRF